jgi:hypothetical protein
VNLFCTNFTSSPNTSQTPQPGNLYRHGDVLISRVTTLPSGVQLLNPKQDEGVTLAYGEITGHSHRIRQNEAAQLWVDGSNMFLEIKNPSATLVHEEHQAIELPQGIYRVWKQREYRPDAFVEVED